MFGGFMEITNSFIINKKIFSSGLSFHKRTCKKEKIQLRNSRSYRQLLVTIKEHKNDFTVSGVKISKLYFEDELRISLRAAKTLKAKRRILRKFFKKNPELLI